MQRNTHLFDILVVYTGSVARSASAKVQTPFDSKSSKSNYNNAYAYLLSMCKKNNITAAFTTTNDAIGDNVFSNYWIYDKDKWEKNKKNCTSRMMFDKYCLTKSAGSLISLNSMEPFNDVGLTRLFYDKQQTFDDLSEFSIPTVTLENLSLSHIKKAHRKLQQIIEAHPNRSDFLHEVVIKDRYGAGGNEIYRVGEINMFENIQSIIKSNKSIS